MTSKTISFLFLIIIQISLCLSNNLINKNISYLKCKGNRFGFEDLQHIHETENYLNLHQIGFKFRIMRRRNDMVNATINYRVNSIEIFAKIWANIR